MSVAPAGWVWLWHRWHLSVREGLTMCGAKLGYPLKGRPDAPRCARCLRFAALRGIEL